MTGLPFGFEERAHCILLSIAVNQQPRIRNPFFRSENEGSQKKFLWQGAVAGRMNSSSYHFPWGQQQWLLDRVWEREEPKKEAQGGSDCCGVCGLQLSA